LTLSNARLHAQERAARAQSASAEARFRALLEHATDGVMLSGRDGTVLYRSPAAELMLGGAATDGGATDAIHPDDRAACHETLRAVLAEPSVPRATIVRARHADGSWRWLETVTQNLLGDPAIGALVTNLRDVTERRAMIEELRASEARYRSIVETTREGVWMMDAAGCTTFANARMAGMLGYDAPEGLLGVGGERFLLEEDRPAARIRAEERRAGVPGQVEVRLVRRDGELVSTLVESTPVLGEAGEFEGLLMMVMDVTARRRAEEERARLRATLESTEEQLRQAQKMEAVGRLAGGIAHDFNNLLTGIISYTHFALEAAREGVAARDDLVEIEKAARSAAQLTRQLLAFSRQQVLSPRVLDLDEILQGLERMLRRTLGEDIELRYLSDGLPHRCHVDPGQIEQVIMNLAVNARDAMPDGGKLIFELAAVHLDQGYAEDHLDVTTGPHVLLAVTDTGVGMDKDTLARIFEPFFTTKELGKGTGLGLSTVFGIIKQSGGHVWVYSEPGLGSSFKVYFPAVDAQPTVQFSSTRAQRPRGGDETLLVVEDDEQVRAVLRTVLTRAGYRVIEAAGGEQALSASDAHPARIHLVLTDLVMPGMNGREVAARLEASRTDLRVLYMSGYTGNTLGERGSIGGDAAFLQKPITPTGLLAKVREVLDAPRPGSGRG